MPWHSGTTGDPGMELAVRYHVTNDLASRRGSAAAILTIDRDNVNVIGPACIAQRLMFAAVAAAAAAPQQNSEIDSDSSNNSISLDVGLNRPNQDNDSDSEANSEAEAVAKAFLESVDSYHCRQDSQAANHCHFSPKNGMSGLLYFGENGNYQYEDMQNCIHEDADEENLQVVFVAPRPRASRQNSCRRSNSGRKYGQNVRILSIESFTSR